MSGPLGGTRAALARLRAYDCKHEAPLMATLEQCQAAIEEAVERFNSIEAGDKRHRVPERTVGCTVLDLDVTYRGRLVDGFLVEVAESEEHAADMRLLCNSDDLVAMVNRELRFSHAWSTGQVRIDASIRDLIKFRALL